MSTIVNPTISDRLLAGIRAIIAAEFPRVTFLGTYEYKVDMSDGTPATPATFVNCSPTDPSITLPTLSNVPIRMPFAVSPPVGALCSIQFLNGDPSRPTCVNFNNPMSVMVFAGGTPVLQGVVRFGDTVQAGPFAGVTTSCSQKVSAG